MVTRQPVVAEGSDFAVTGSRPHKDNVFQACFHFVFNYKNTLFIRAGKGQNEDFFDKMHHHRPDMPPSGRKKTGHPCGR
jgi:hypothetical protein